jgi:hypothetical protein
MGSTERVGIAEEAARTHQIVPDCVRMRGCSEINALDNETHGAFDEVLRTSGRRECLLLRLVLREQLSELGHSGRPMAEYLRAVPVRDLRNA